MWDQRERGLRRQEALARFSDRAVQDEDLDEILAEACRAIVDADEAELAAIFEFQDDSDSLRLKAGAGWQAGAVGRATIPAARRSPTALAFRSGEPVVAADLAPENGFDIPALHADHGIRSSLAAIIRLGTARPAYGVLELATTSSRSFDETDVGSIKLWANLIAGSVARLGTLATARRGDAFARGILQASPDAIRVVGADGRVEFLNAQGRRLHELADDEDTVGLVYADLWPTAEAQRVREALHAVRDGDRMRLEVSGPTVRGTMKRWELTMAPMHETLAPDAAVPARRVVVVSRDMTDRWTIDQALRDSEERLRATFQAAPVGIVVAEAPSGRIVDANAQANEVFGRNVLSVSDAPADTTWKAFHADGTRMEAALCPLARALAGEEAPAIDVHFETGPGQRRWISLRAAPLRREDGAVAGAIMTALDVDLQKRAAALLLEANESLTAAVQDRNRDLAEANRSLNAEIDGREAAEGLVRQLQKMEAVGQLTGGIAHDFNNMLAVIISGLTLVQRRLARGETDVGRFIEAAMEAAHKAATLTQRLLAFSRQQALSPVALDMNRLVEGMSDLLNRTLGEAIRLETGLASGLWTTHADVNQLENAVLNLAVNARDAMGEGGRLLIETANVEATNAPTETSPELVAGHYVTLSVTDTGSGVPPELIGRVFDPFFTTKEVGKGTGLGLSQVYGFVKQSGGHVKIASEVGQGTVVRIYLPRYSGAVSEIARPAAAPIGPARGETILVVEDERRVRELTVAGLRELGFTTIDADNAASALRLLDENEAIALLFTDIVMPDVNGRRLADEALRRRPGLKLLFTSGYTRDTVIHDGALDAGIDLLHKPFSLDELARKVRSALDR